MVDGKMKNFKVVTKRFTKCVVGLVSMMIEGFYEPRVSFFGTPLALVYSVSNLDVVVNASCTRSEQGRKKTKDLDTFNSPLLTILTGLSCEVPG
jgi:hypothetical protein